MEMSRSDLVDRKAVIRIVTESFRNGWISTKTIERIEQLPSATPYVEYLYWWRELQLERGAER